MVDIGIQLIVLKAYTGACKLIHVKAAGAEYFFIGQDMTYGRDPFECIEDPRKYLTSIGW
ncbi:hypothetical protein [Corynebacterium deserti]|uniref:hypothetical protein n=1 Tax=Corynebacterium deserti TaxID=1408191 RepID=UPI0006AD5DE9|nr:hypothetical protein [Corynebacterium deserti]